MPRYKSLVPVFVACLAHQLYHVEVIPVLRNNQISEDTIHIVNNASLESQLLFLRKLNEFFKPLPKDRTLEPDDLRAEHYTGFQSPGGFLNRTEVIEINKRVGHITLKEVRKKKMDWRQLVQGCLPLAIDRLLTFFQFLRDNYPTLSSAAKADVQFYLDQLKTLKAHLFTS